MRSDEALPDTALIYYLMHRGSVTPKTMAFCIETVRDEIPIINEDLYETAEWLANRLWDDLTSVPESV